MSVVGQWRRSMLGAGGVALLLPLGLALGVALTTAFGGGNTLRALGQVFAGPSSPVGRRDDNGLESTKQVPDVPVRHHAATHPTVTGTQVPVTGGNAGTSGGGTQQPGTQGGGSSGGGGNGGGGNSGGGGNGGGSTTPQQPQSQPSPPSSPPPAPTPHSPVHQAGQSVADTAKALPVAGPVVGNAVQTVVDLIP